MSLRTLRAASNATRAARYGRASIVAALVTALWGCLPADHPRRHPVVLTELTRGGMRAWAADLDGDGWDERLLLRGRSQAWPAVGPHRRLLFSGGDYTDQTNYDGEILEPQFVDLEADGTLEVVVPLLRNDSLFFSVASARGQKLFAFFVASGTPRVEPDGALPWDPAVHSVWAADVDGNGTRELVTVITTAYARYPRGVLVHSLPGGEKLGEVLMGAPPVAALLSDFDGDGLPEVLAATMTSRHGADLGGFNDFDAYLVLIDLHPTPEVAWSRNEGTAGQARLAWTDHDGDGQREILLARGQGNLQMEILDPGTLSILRRREVEGQFYTPVLVDLDRDLQPEIVASLNRGRAVVMADHDLQSIREVPVPFPTGYAFGWPDLDGDGVAELEVRSGEGFALLRPDLTVKAVFPSGRVTGVQRQAAGMPARLLIESGGGAVTAEPRPNRWYLLLRYGPLVLAFAIPLTVWLLVVQVRRLRYRLRVVHAAGVEALEAGGRGLMVLDTRGRIRWRGPGLDAAFPREPVRIPDLRRLGRVEPSLAEWCHGVLSSRPARPRTGTVELNGGDGGHEAEVSMSPVIIGSSHDPHWMVELDGGRHVDQGTWPMLAQRIVHAVKNPLTHMLLTVQRLQAEYRERAPAVASRLDPYADRIQDGIGQLRRLTSNFLKLTDLADPELEDLDLGAFITDFGDRYRPQLPHDIRLRVEVNGGVPPTRVDREQVVVALDNLVTNAVNALESGGTITLTVTPHSRLRLEGDPEPRDYVQIEVMDTGRGIPEEARKRVFEPGFTTAEEGSGLGLAIVRKIVADHGGHVVLESEPGVGTVFSLYLPAGGSGVTEEAP